MEVPVRLSMTASTGKGRKLMGGEPSPSPSPAPNASPSPAPNAKVVVLTPEDKSGDAAKPDDKAKVADSMSKGAIFSLVKGFMMRGSPVINVEYKEHCEEVSLGPQRSQQKRAVRGQKTL
jgi:hypothetical protein